MTIVCSHDTEQVGAQRQRKQSKGGKQLGRKATKQGEPSTSDMGYDVMAEQAALAALKLGWDEQPGAGASSTLDQWTPQTAVLRGQLMESEADRQRLQQELDALRRSHKALASRYAKMKQQIKNTEAQDSISMASAASRDVDQLRVLRQQLEQANRNLAQQQETNKQQAAELQQALSKIAATKQLAAAAVCQGKDIQQQPAGLQAGAKQAMTAAQASFEAEQQQVKQQMADMAAAVAAANAATRRAQLEECAVLQALAHMAQQRAEEQAELKQTKQQLAAARAHLVITARQLAAVKADKQRLEERVAEADARSFHLETRVVQLALSVKRVCADWEAEREETRQMLVENAAKCDAYMEATMQQAAAVHQAELAAVKQEAVADKAQASLQLAAVKRQAAAAQAQASLQLAQLRVLLERSSRGVSLAAGCKPRRGPLGWVRGWVAA